jgi:murein DD-endopeptidase MepM/ murein hydrolase activator NlpD
MSRHPRSSAAQVRRGATALAVTLALVPAAAIAAPPPPPASTAAADPGADARAAAVIGSLARGPHADVAAGTRRTSQPTSRSATHRAADATDSSTATAAGQRSSSADAAEDRATVAVAVTGAPAAPAATTASAPGSRRGERGEVFATAGGVDLHLPSDVLAVGFHESGSRNAVRMLPIGTPTSNHNAGRVTLPPASADNRYFVLPTRRRPGTPTSAVDIRVEHGKPIASVVDGTVTAVSEYRLYGRTPDQVVEIRSERNPDIKVRMLHVEGVQVAPGDRVRAGETVVAASSRQLPFASQIDRFSSRGPHVHVELRHKPEPAAAAAPAPAVPTAPELEPQEG